MTVIDSLFCTTILDARVGRSAIQARRWTLEFYMFRLGTSVSTTFIRATGLIPVHRYKGPLVII